MPYIDEWIHEKRDGFSTAMPVRFVCGVEYEGLIGVDGDWDGFVQKRRERKVRQSVYAVRL